MFPDPPLTLEEGLGTRLVAGLLTFTNNVSLSQLVLCKPAVFFFTLQEIKNNRTGLQDYSKGHHSPNFTEKTFTKPRNS